jgi:hypothetical protein
MKVLRSTLYVNPQPTTMAAMQEINRLQSPVLLRCRFLGYPGAVRLSKYPRVSLTYPITTIQMWCNKHSLSGEHLREVEVDMAGLGFNRDSTICCRV